MSVTTVRTWQKAMDTKKEERKMKTIHSYCFNPYGILGQDEELNREERSLEFEKALRNSDIPKHPGLGIVFSSPYGLKGLENFEEVIDLGDYESPEEALAKFIPDKKDYYDVMLVY